MNTSTTSSQRSCRTTASESLRSPRWIFLTIFATSPTSPAIDSVWGTRSPLVSPGNQRLLSSRHTVARRDITALGISPDRMRRSPGVADPFEELGLGGTGMVTEYSSHLGGRRDDSRDFDSTHGHAHVLGLQHHSQALGFQLRFQEVRDLRRQGFLYVESLCNSADSAWKFR